MNIIEFLGNLLFCIFVAIFLIKTKIYKILVKVFDKILPFIYSAIVILFPFAVLIIYIFVCNFLSVGQVEVSTNNISNSTIINSVNKIIFYVFYFIYINMLLSFLYYIAIKDKQDKICLNSKEMNISYIRMKYLIIVNNILIFLAFSYIYCTLIFNINLFNMNIIEFIKQYNLNKINMNNLKSEYSFQMVILLFITLFFIFCINWLAAYFMSKAIIYFKKNSNKNINSSLIIKLLIYFPFINIINIFYIRKKYGIKIT
jgi:hypothetical protein